MSDLVLYNYFRSSASYRIRIALHWKGLSFQYKPVHLLQNGGEQHLPQYKSLNPAAEVPTLIHGNHTLSQSMAILQYLDDNFVDRPSFPKDSYLKAKVIQFCEGINCTQPLQNLKVQQYLEKEFNFTPEQKEKWVHKWIESNLESSEKLLEKTAGTYCFGSDVTAADMFLIPQLFAAQRFNIKPTKFPMISRIQENCEKLEAFQKSHPLNQIDTPVELKK